MKADLLGQVRDACQAVAERACHVQIDVARIPEYAASLPLEQVTHPEHDPHCHYLGHGDDRLVWVNPHDSRHVMKADDGSMGISYDRGLTWLMITNLPVSQWYHVNVDMRKPYWVYGGLQDNGSWMGPSATYREDGVLFEDWLKTGGGDGFMNLVDTTDNKTLYTESQYLGLTRIDLPSGARTSIRPDNWVS